MAANLPILIFQHKNILIFLSQMAPALLKPLVPN